MIAKAWALLRTASHCFARLELGQFGLQTIQLRQRPACKTGVTRKPQHESVHTWNYGGFTRFITFHHVSL